MPVSFNVPQQTKRSRYVIDTFQGVDFTSAGIDVDTSRSPNAPNMVRHTPGKVRKRMGYSKEIQFGAITNVNYAVGTSLKEQDIKIKESDTGSQIPLYDLIEPIANEGSAATIYYEFDYKAEHNFSIYPGGNSISTSEEWTHYSGSLVLDAGEIIKTIYISSLAAQDIYIKCFAAMKAKNEAYKWNPAPKVYREQDGNTCCNGCHNYNIPSSSKSYVNMNRVVSSSNTFEDYSISSDQTTLIGELQEPVYYDDVNNKQRKLYLEFDYQLTGSSNATFWVNGGGTNKIILTPTSTTKHISATQMAGDEDVLGYFWAQTITAGATATLRIKNLFIGYAKDDNYQWEPSPEQMGEPNQGGLLFWVGDKNHSTINRHEEQITTSTKNSEDKFTIIPEGTPGIDNIRGYFYISFNVQLIYSGSGYINSSISLECDTGGVSHGHDIGDFNLLNTSQKIEYYGGIFINTDYPQKIRIVNHFTSAVTDRTYTSIVTDIEVKEIYPRDISTLSSRYFLYHMGSKLWLATKNNETQLLYSSAADKKSWATQFGEYLIIFDKENIYNFKLGMRSIYPIDPDNCYVPLITIAKSPSGGGTSFEPLNMMTPAFTEQFIVTSEEATVKQFQLSFSELDNKTVKAWLLASNGTWVEKTQGTDFSVNRTTGLVTFVTAPGATPISGQDNVKIQAYRTVKGYRDRIAKCTFATVYGVNAIPDRLFVAGNPDYPAQDFYSEQNDYTYFPDTNYSLLGTAGGVITGYAKIGNYLGTFKRETDHENSLILREGVVNFLEDGSVETVFKTVNTLQGEGMVSPYTIGYLEGEPLYLSKKGIFAVTASDGTDNRYGQNRSYYLNGKLEDEQDIEDSHSTVFNNMYIMALNNQLYILDGLQPSYSENEPYSTKQYSAFHCDSVPATSIWSDEDDLYFGTADGKICKFYKDDEDIASYQDDGYPISASWETPDLDGYLFYKNKTFRYFAMRLMKAMRTSYKLYAEKYSVWTFIKEDDTTGRVFDFTKIDFNEFTFSTDWAEKLSHTKLRVKKVDKARFKVENTRLYQPFGIYDMALEYLENGNYKR